MSSPFYFFDQFSSASHIGGIRRSKRDANDFNQALDHFKVVLAAEDENSNKLRPTTSIPTKKRTDDKNLQKILGQFKSPSQPEILTEELDTILQNFDEKPKITSSSSPSKSSQDTSLPKISLPSSLILRLYSTWSDLIKNTEYTYKVWRTKAAEEKWRQYVQEKCSEQIKSEKQQIINDHQSTLLRRKSSRENRASLTNVLHQPYLTRNVQIRGSRSSARASFLSASGMTHDNLRLLKAIHQEGLENATESNKNNIHIQFKLSTQIDQTAQSNQLDKQKTVLFDVPKPEVNFDKEMIILTQNKCKSLLAETKRKILATTNDHGTQHTKISRIWFYEDNRFIRNKNNLLALNEINRRPKSKFALAILRYEIPEQYNINIDTPETKSKCYIEFVDGSRQIYYPSGRLAVLRLRSPFSTTLFFDDTNVTAKQLLGLITSTGDVILMQPTFHARLITNSQHKYAFLCNGKTGTIEKQLRWYSKNNYSRRESPPIDEDDIHLPLYENTVQLQLNSFMQLEYNNPSNIRFAFTCQNEEFKFQLGVQSRTQSSTPIDSTTVTHPTNKLFVDQKNQRNRSSSINSNDVGHVSKKQQTQSQKLTDEPVHFHQLPIMRELILLRKRIEHICDSWLKEYRTTLGIMDIDSYCFSDLPLSSPQPSNNINRSENTNQSKYLPILAKRVSLNNDYIKSIDKQQLLRRSTRISQANVIRDSIEQFIPRSDVGQRMKQRIQAKKNSISTTLPIIKSH